jgi:DNA-binding FrmR family transcriptional regulator
MVEVDRYCLEEIQQAKAITAAMREAAMLILSSHLDAGVDCAVRSEEPEAVVTEVKSVIRAALKL